MVQKSFLSIAMIALLGVSGSSCENEATQEQIPDADLVGTQWIIESIQLSNGDQVYPDDRWTNGIIFSEDDQLEGSLACNFLTGEFELGMEDSITINSFGSTKIYCGNQTDEYVTQFFESFRQIHSFKISGNQLELLSLGSTLKYKYTE